MAPQIKSVIILGAGGNVGNAILPEALKSGLVVSVLSRPESKSTFPSNVKVIKSSYDKSDLVSAFKGQDAVICLVGGSALGEQKNIIDAAADAGVKWFIPSEFGSDTLNKELNEYMHPVFAPKLAAVDALRSKESTGLSWTAFITGALFDFCLRVGFLGFNLKDRTAEFWDNGNATFSSTNLATVAKAVVGLLTHPDRLDACKNRYVNISSYTATQSDMLAIVEKESGEKWKVTKVDGAKTGAEGQAMLAKGDFGPIAFKNTISQVNLGEDLNWGDHMKGKGDNDLLLPGNKEDLKTQLKSALAN